jgi:excisionase family DNA binding protein
MVQAVLNRKHVARMLSCSVGTVDNLVRRGELKHTRRWAGGPKCFTFEQVNEYVESHNRRQKEFQESFKLGSEQDDEPPAA